MTTPLFSAVYYSHGRAPLQVRQHCLATTSAAVAAIGGELITVTWEPLVLEDLVVSHTIVWPQHVAMHHNLYQQILAGVARAAANTICLVEHDVLYAPDYFTAMVAAVAANPDKLIYNHHLIGLDSISYFVPRWPYNMLSNLAATKDVLVRQLQAKVAEVIRVGDVAISEPDGAVISTPTPTVDIRHQQNFTGNREAAEHLPMVHAYWGHARRWLPASLRLFVLSHRQDLLDAVSDQPCFHKVNLARLPLGRYQSNLLGEGRAVLYDIDIGVDDADYFGLVNARWDDKYPNLQTRLANLNNMAQPQLAASQVLTPWATDSDEASDWYYWTTYFHPSMADLLDELAAFSGLSLRTGRVSLWANDFICQRDVWYSWRQFWRRCFTHFHGRYGFLLPYRSEDMDVARLPAYFYERVTTLYFANRADLHVIQLT